MGILGRLSGFLGLGQDNATVDGGQGGEWRNAGEGWAGEEDGWGGAEEVRVQVAETRRTDLVTILYSVSCSSDAAAVLLLACRCCWWLVAKRVG